MLSSEPSRSAEPTGPVLRLSRAAANKAFIAYAVLLLAGGWSYAVLSIQTDYHRTLEATRNQLRTVAAGFEAQVDAMLNDGIGAAFAAANQLEASGSLSTATDTEASSTLARMLTGGEYVRSVFIGSSTWFARAGREGHLEQGAPPPWFNALTDPEPGGDAVAGSLVADPDRPPHRVIPIARRVGSVHYRDVWVGGLFDFHELNDLYRKSLGPSSALLLLSLDGNILVRVPNMPGVDASKTPIGNTDLFRRAMSTPNAGVVEGIAPLMLTPVIAAYQRVSGYPLYVAAGVRRDAALASWKTRRRDTLVLTAVASVVLIAMTWMLNHYVGALRGRELHYRTLFNNAGFSAFMLDGDEFTEANRTTLSMFAMPAGAEVRGLKPWDVSPERQPDGTPSRELAERRIATAREQGQAKFEWMHKRMDSGEPFPAEVELSTVRTDGRTLTLAVVHDLTERKRAEQSWRESEARYRALIEALPEAVIVHRGGEPLFGNQAAAALVGAASVAALASQSVLSFVVEADRDAFRERGRLILEQGQVAGPREVRIQRLDGSMFWAEAEGVPVSFDGKPAVQTIVRDITARKLQEESRAAAAERTRQQSAALLRLATRSDARADDLHAALSRICTSACHVLAAHRVDIFSLEEDAVTMRWVAACAEGRIVPAPAHVIPLRKVSALLGSLRSQRVIALAHLHEDSTGVELLECGLVGNDAVSAIAAAIHTAGELVAFALVTHCDAPREWHADEVTFAGGIADQIAQAFLDAQRELAFDELRELAGQLVRSQDETRRHIGRDLHDSTGQTLAALEMNLARLSRAAGESPPEQGKVLAECIELASQCSAEIRTASYLLHPPLLDELGLASALRWMADGFRERSGIEVTLDLPPALARFDRDSELALFRVAQEALTNVHRHSGSRSARLSVKSRDDTIVLEIEDAGRGLPQATVRVRESGPGLSVGLAGMRERMRQIGGTVVVESGATGTRISASLPRAAAPTPRGSA